LAGCGERELPLKERVQARGRVLLNGEPVRYALITLEPTDPKRGMTAEGKTDGDGNFALRTYSNEEPDGAVPGEYKVSLEAGGGIPVGGVPKDEPGPTLITSELPEVIVFIEDDDNELEIRIP
jgi:hypothetical protein